MIAINSNLVRSLALAVMAAVGVVLCDASAIAQNGKGKENGEENGKKNGKKNGKEEDGKEDGRRRQGGRGGVRVDIQGEGEPRRAVLE